MTAERILVVNAGSSSVKVRLLDGDELIGEENHGPVASEDDGHSLARAIERLPPPDAVGHRFVHGGPRFERPATIDDEVRRALEGLRDLAPLHQTPALHALAATDRAVPDAPAVACFDTTFHVTMPPGASTYAIPERWRSELRVRRYGFHGLSHAYASRRAGRMLDAPDARIVVCHLGSGASLSAVAHGESLDTTMGFTPLDGLVMSTRSGSLDPGLVLWLAQHTDHDPAELSDVLERESGLLALAGTGDMREVLSREAAGDEAASLALEVYLHRLRAEIAAMTAALGGLDALVFTGGIGEASPTIRDRACRGLDYLGIAIDGAANARTAGDADGVIGMALADVAVLVVATREDLEIARQVRSVLAWR